MTAIQQITRDAFNAGFAAGAASLGGVTGMAIAIGEKKNEHCDEGDW